MQISRREAQATPTSRPKSRKFVVKKKREAKKLSRTAKPEHLTLHQWQLELRRQFGSEQEFGLKNIGEHPVFSEFLVTNPKSKRTYQVKIRGNDPGVNSCSCPDFATNDLGTCKHIEFLIAKLAKGRKTAKPLHEGFKPAYSELIVRSGSQRLIEFRPGSECPVALSRLVENYFNPDLLLPPEAAPVVERFLTDTAKIDHELRVDDGVLGLIAERRDADHRQAAVSKAFPSGRRSAAFKNLLNANLYDYQRDGILFAAKAGRCLIGDEMGLGKTIQAIGAAEVMSRLFGVDRVLIVCPTSLKQQWYREIERFSDRSAHVISGSKHRRAQEFLDNSKSSIKITNYDTIHFDIETINKWTPDLIILDEAQRIKNWNTRTAKSVKQLKSPYAIVLTGTPLENRLEELISIVQFVDQYRLGPTYKLLHEHQILDEAGGKVIGYRNLDQIGKTLAPILLRRQKTDVQLELPERIDQNIFVPMTDAQRDIHEENGEIVARIVEKWRRLKFLSEADKLHLMAALQKMRMVCDSTYLIDPSVDQGHKVEEVSTLLAEVLEQPDSKIVLFSQWLRMHELVTKRALDHDWGFELFHGGLSQKQRSQAVDRFRNDPDCRLFFATDAGGVGLNLQWANTVFNLDLPWNPAVLEQRVGRVHRLGQQQSVQVVNFISEGGIEYGMLSLLKFKRSLFSGVLDGGPKDVSMGGTRLKRFMESVQSATNTIDARTIPSAPDRKRPDSDQSTATEHQPSEPIKTAAATSRENVPSVSKTAAENEARLTENNATSTNLERPLEPATPSMPINAPVADLIQQGMALLSALATASQPDQADTPDTEERPNRLVRRDEHTGEPYLRLPVPPPEVVNDAVRAFSSLLQHLGQKQS